MTESRQRNEVDEREHNGIGRNTMSGGCGGRQIRRERIADIACDDLRKIEISSTRHVHVMCTGNSGTSRDTFIGMFSIFHLLNTLKTLNSRVPTHVKGLKTASLHMNTTTVSTPSWWCCIQTHHHRHHSPPHFFPRPIHPQFKSLRLLYRKRVVESRWENGAVSGSNEFNVSPWDDKPYEILPNGKRSYLDEQDVVAFLDPPNTLIPLDPTSYNPAAYLWKKIEDIPEERRHRLLLLINPRLISMAWQIAGTRYEDPKLVKKRESTLLIHSNKDDAMLEYYNCRTSGGPMPISWINSFRKVIFSGKDGNTYGRLIGGSALASFANSFAPLYFTMTQVKEVLSTEQPCDLAYEFGDGLYDIKELPLGFPRPVKHPYPFNDQIVIYVRYLGPGVSVGQAWQEGNKLEQIPQKLCGEILMVKDYTSLQERQ